LSEHAPALAVTLRRVRQSTGRRALLAGLMSGVAGGLAVLLIAILLLALKQSWARPAGWFTAAAAFVAILLLALRRARGLHRDNLEAARLLGRVSPTDASDLVSAVELTREGTSDVSEALVRAHLVRMSARAARIDPRPARDLRPLVVGGALLGGLVGIHALVYELGGSRLRESYAFLMGKTSPGSTPLFTAEPIAGDVTLTYHYPAHMNRTPRTVAGSDGEISAPKGTVIDLTARADRDVSHASAVVTEGGQAPKVVPLEVHGRALTGRLQVEQEGTWRFRYTRASGLIAAEGPDQHIAIEPDAVPEVRLTKPDREKEVAGQEELTLAYSASDDYGLTALDLVWNTGTGAPEQRKRLFQIKGASKHESGEVTWDLSQLGLKPGDRVTYRLEAFDNDSVSGGETGKKGVSNTQELKVFSETEHHEEVLKQAREQWEKLIGGMGDRLEEPPCGATGEKTSPEWESATGTKDGMIGALALDMRALSRKLAQDSHAPPEIGHALAHVATRLAGAVDLTSDTRRSLMHFPSAASARSFVSTLGGEVHEEEHDVLYLEDLMDRERLRDMAALTRELEQGRRELADLVKQYKASPTEATKQRILAQVSRLKERLNDLYRRMQELAGEIQDEHLNREAREMMDRNEDLMSKLDEVQRDLAKGGGDEALKAVEDLQKQIDKLEQNLEQRAGEADDDQKKLAAQLQQLASDLIDLQGDETQLKKDTEQVRSREREAAKEKAKKLGAEFLEKQRERTRRALSEMGKVDSKLAERYGEEDKLQGAQEYLNRLDRALQSGDFNEASEQVQQAVRDGEQVRMRLAEERDINRQFQAKAPDTDGLNQSVEHADQAQGSMRQVQEDLEKLLRSSRPALSEGERKQLQEMEKRQSGAEQRAQQLSQRLEEITKQAPIAGPEQLKMLQDAAGSMGEAKEDLGTGDARGASSRESDALEKLSKFAQSMKQRGSSGGQGGGVPMPFGPDGEEEGPPEQDGEGTAANNNSKVELPSADQSHAPAEFRKDILDAMKDAAPEKYRERVRNYYEELVK
jgi:hypothetical protein